MHTRVHADMPACLRTMAPRRALGGLKRAVRVRVLRRFCAPVCRAATVPVLAPWLALEGLARGAARGVSMAGAGAVGVCCRMRTRSGQAGYPVDTCGGRWHIPPMPRRVSAVSALPGVRLRRVCVRTLTGGSAQVGGGLDAIEPPPQAGEVETAWIPAAVAGIPLDAQARLGVACTARSLNAARTCGDADRRQRAG